MTAILLVLMMQAKSCRWITEATADRVVGAQTAVTLTPNGCNFSHQNDFLRIEVFASSPQLKPFLKHCKSSPEPVNGIGNEAAVCDGGSSEQIAAGRVREHVFVLRLKAPFSRDLLRAKLRALADLVSGNLY